MLYILRLVMDDQSYHDTARGFVVRAKSSGQARELASSHCGDEGIAAWLDPEQSTCAPLHPVGVSRVILRDFIAG